MDKETIVLAQNMFVSDRRKDEILFSVKQNIRNEYIDKFLFMFEDDPDENTCGKTWDFLHNAFNGNKLVGNISGRSYEVRGKEWERPSYNQILKLCNEVYTNGEIIVLTSNDIFFIIQNHTN